MIVKVTHPDYGHVVFTNPTLRQQEVLSEYQKLINSANDAETT